MKTCVLDIEANGLEPTKIHCLTAAIHSGGEWRSKTTTDYNEMRKFLTTTDILIGHNIARWDIPHLERLLEIKVEAKVIDTLALSWYLYPQGIDGKMNHGLEFWGNHFGVPKPKIKPNEWLAPLEGETFEQFQNKMIHRCEEDVRINCLTYDTQMSELNRIYGDPENEERLINYLMEKMDCAVEAEKSRWKVDVKRCKENFDILSAEKAVKVKELSSIMPEVVSTKVVKRPKSLYLKGKTVNKPKVYVKQDGSKSTAGINFDNACQKQGVDPEEVDSVYVPSNELSSAALTWLDALNQLGLKESHQEDVEIESGVKEGNPNSPQQVKDWLFSLGWEPQNFNYTKKVDEDGREYTDEIPQLRIDGEDGKELCPSVKKLFKVEPRLEVMEGLTVLTHRLGILKGYLSNMDDEGYVKAEIQGFTNTLRFKHRVVVNLPSKDKPYGELVRGVLIALDGYELCGSDMSALENRTRDHYIYPYDPDYVETMMDKSYDPHLAIAVQAGFITEEDSEFYKWYKKSEEDKTPEQSDRFTKIDFERQKGKTTNYASVYGAGGAKIAEAADIPEEEGFALHKSYWKVNWSVKAMAADQTVKFFYKLGNGALTYKIYKGGDLLPSENDSKAERRAKYNLASTAEEMWLWNPVSKLWYSLRYAKDIFSTLNQGTGVWAFDTWIRKFREKRPQLTAQMHDEVILCVKKGYREGCEKMLRDAIKETNEELKLNRDLDIDIKFGNSYANIH